MLPSFSIVAALLLIVGSTLAVPISLLEALLDTQCDLSKAVLPLGGLDAPSSDVYLFHVAIGQGTQNYTCKGLDDSASPKATGAVATLYNASCSAVWAPDRLAATPSYIYDITVPTSSNPDALQNLMLSGHHFFTNSTTPRFDLDVVTTAAGNGLVDGSSHEWGAGSLAKKQSVPAATNLTMGTNGLGSVSWLRLVKPASVDGAWEEVYRVNTAGGVAPSTCKDNSDQDFTVQYAATYWLYKKK